jgi:hypothetical protein
MSSSGLLLSARVAVSTYRFVDGARGEITVSHSSRSTGSLQSLIDL